MKTITRDQLKRMNDTQHEDFVLINVLSRESFLEEHIRTSINVPVDDERFVELVESIR